ncbi:hypothetical protein, partial [Acinetobacter baumannii]|uniref:hypothetical protein n=1 Tax=Acinetobacter baumannii TaxID=470 RepID=UPI000AB7921D
GREEESNRVACCGLAGNRLRVQSRNYWKRLHQHVEQGEADCCGRLLDGKCRSIDRAERDGRPGAGAGWV